MDAASAGSTSGLSFLVGYAAPLTGLPTSFGELLVDVTSPFVASDLRQVVAGLAAHRVAIPNDLTIQGFASSTQVYLGPKGVLTNAMDLVLGF